MFSVEEMPCKLSVYDYIPRVGTDQHRSVYYGHDSFLYVIGFWKIKAKLAIFKKYTYSALLVFLFPGLSIVGWRGKSELSLSKTSQITWFLFLFFPHWEQNSEEVDVLLLDSEPSDSSFVKSFELFPGATKDFTGLIFISFCWQAIFFLLNMDDESIHLEAYCC